MPKAFLTLALTGIGWLLAYTPSVWRLVVYTIPVFAFSLLLICIYKFFKGTFHYEDES